MTGLRHLLTTLAGDDAVRVIVFDSAEPDFFLAHVDMTATPEALAGLMADLPDGVNVFQAVGEQVRHQPQVTIVKLAGQARGGGAEFVTAADLAFAAIGRAGLGRIEALTGIIPGGGATVRPGQPRRPAGALDEFVDRLAGTIAALPDGWAGLLFRPGTAQLMGAGLAHGAQTRDGEQDLEGLFRGLAAWSNLFEADGEPSGNGGEAGHLAGNRTHDV